MHFHNCLLRFTQANEASKHQLGKYFDKLAEMVEQAKRNAFKEFEALEKNQSRKISIKLINHLLQMTILLALLTS